MDLFTQIKMGVSVKEAAEYYGLEVNRGSMVCCPFHADRTPSMKLNEDYFYCFGCGAHGDVIDLVAKLFNLSSYDAAKKLAYDFGIDPDKPPAAAALRKPKYPLAKAFQNETLHCQRILYDYLHLLEHWKMQYAPKTPDDLRAPAETQRSGFGGKRTSDRERESCRLRRDERFVVRSDDSQHRICLVCGEAAALPNALGGAWPHTPKLRAEAHTHF